ncbi:MAG: prepilin-type N-terminal cleavage/methylation domain-containing protein [Candidatus Omnitrophica bacterium]|jgi:prepilin-type N-terminal cleavage/methylation domain-containing protein|nr:prepilin-type N-terminal cleavage/methylation domain-containing protein [Candidatus Omnitrophota bacterium]
MKRAFTLLELIIVIIVVGILAVLGLTQYSRVLEKSRVAEAMAILGAARKAQISYYTEKGAYTSSYTELGIGVPAGCTSTHYFSYSYNVGAWPCDGGSYNYASRCTINGKTPNAQTTYIIRLCTDTGIWTNDAY